MAATRLWDAVAATMQDCERALLIETAETEGTVVIRCRRCQAQARRTDREPAFSVSPRHHPLCPAATAWR